MSHSLGYSVPRSQAVVTFNIDADLRSVFSWNTKQLFVYLQVSTPVLPTAASLWSHLFGCSTCMLAVDSPGGCCSGGLGLTRTMVNGLRACGACDEQGAAGG